MIVSIGTGNSMYMMVMTFFDWKLYILKFHVLKRECIKLPFKIIINIKGENKMKKVEQEYLSGERALFKSDSLEIRDCIFGDGESPLKESSNLTIVGSIFKWKYPVWYCQKVTMKDTTLLETARSGIWYTHNIEVKNSIIEAPKTFRKSSHITLEHVNMPNALESLWNCQDIVLDHVTVKGDYFGFNSSNMEVKDVTISGNYCFDGGKNIEVHNSKLLSKDAFWNCENVVVYDSIIIGEYLGWNSKNITFINCTIESLQGLCYIENLKLVNCKLINTSLAFEYSSVDATVINHIDSIMNPLSGHIKAKSIGEVILDASKVDPNKTTIDVETTYVETKQQTGCVCC